MKKFNLPVEKLNNIKLDLVSKIKKPNNIKSDTIFKQLPEKKERQVFNIKIQFTNKVKGAIALACATTLVLSGSFASNYLKTHENNVFSTDSFTIIEEGKELCKVRDSEILNKVLLKLEDDLEESFQHDIAIENKFEVVASKAKDSEIASEDQVYSILEQNVDYSILAYAINIDGEQIGILNSEY